MGYGVGKEGQAELWLRFYSGGLLEPLEDVVPGDVITRRRRGQGGGGGGGEREGEEGGGRGEEEGDGGEGGGEEVTFIKSLRTAGKSSKETWLQEGGFRGPRTRTKDLSHSNHPGNQVLSASRRAALLLPKRVCVAHLPTLLSTLF